MYRSRAAAGGGWNAFMFFYDTEEESYTIHRLVQLFAKNWLRKERRLQNGCGRIH
jgi:hypothetical protein